MNDETALKELISMARIYRSRGQADKAEECLALARHIELRLSQRASETSSASLSTKTTDRMQTQPAI